MISMLRLSAPATRARLGNLETVGNLVEAASEEGRVLETLMNPQFGLKQAMLSPGGKSPAHSEHAMLHSYTSTDTETAGMRSCDRRISAVSDINV